MDRSIFCCKAANFPSISFSGFVVVVVAFDGGVLLQSILSPPPKFVPSAHPKLPFHANIVSSYCLSIRTRGYLNTEKCEFNIFV